MEAYNELKQGERGAWLSIIAYVILSFVKIFIGQTASSEALMADGLNNATDIIVSISVLIGLKISRKPPDRDHPYGHFRAETVASLIASFIMVAVGLHVLYQATMKVFQPALETPDMVAAWTALGGATVMFLVFWYNQRLAKRINSNAMRAVAVDNRSDALVSIGAFIGIVGSQFGLPWLDPLTAFIVGLIICKTAWDIFRDSSHALTDGFDDKKLEEIKATISKISGVKCIKDIKGRVHGNNVFIDVIIGVDPSLNVVESHTITEIVEEKLKKEHRIAHSHIHIEPE
ncbi:cation diffusion facilitator family transporter [Bacillus horti]|uniref:Cation diffusion facilitator family transporter n=1 Tax=Caldalkalibacillus horti TaxID=77523 RepID=A0ABT9VVV6_9BACI|nr:cation diffusion facilitator family transporter [Bacillus horti]MDQ0165102.1 cation diffusion facilitator family transporter [Bacillus horti]